MVIHKTYSKLDLPYSYDEKQKPILGFSGKHRFMSNFYQEPDMFTLFGISFDSSERAYMYFKSDDPEYQRSILLVDKPKDCKALGYTCKLREGWDEYLKFEVMHRVLQAKYDNPKFWDWLQDTDKAYLEETNTWNDIVWGKCRGKGSNNLGRLTMVIRDSKKTLTRVRR